MLGGRYRRDTAKLGQISQKTKLAEAIRYAPSRWDGLTRFLDDGRMEIDSNVVERSIRLIALNRKNALFSGSDGGGEHWAVIASLIETCKLCGAEPLNYLTDVITKIVNGHPNSQIDDLLPWSYCAAYPPGTWPENIAYARSAHLPPVPLHRARLRRCRISGTEDRGHHRQVGYLEARNRQIERVASLRRPAQALDCRTHSRLDQPQPPPGT